MANYKLLTFDDPELNGVFKIIKNEEEKFIGKIFGSKIEDNVIEQIVEISKTKGFMNCVMLPDAHAGECPVGVVIETRDYVHFNWIGSDIGCGISGVKFNLKPTPELVDRIAKNVLEEYTSINKIPSIGQGNHFFEIAEDKEGNMWFVIHSGSRGYGGLAYKAISKELKLLGINGVHKDSQLFKIFWKSFTNAELVADINRFKILDGARAGIEAKAIKIISTIHNTIKIRGNKVFHYKGAAHVNPGDYAIIPLNMRDGSLIIQATDKVAKLKYAINHGAGRVSSRSYFLITHDESVLEGINYYSEKPPIDEAPEAYKDIMYDMEWLKSQGYIKIIDWLKPLATVKV